MYAEVHLLVSIEAAKLKVLSISVSMKDNSSCEYYKTALLLFGGYIVVRYYFDGTLNNCNRIQ